MSAPPPDSPPSISSSGHSDGLGRRVIVFDREDGAMLEALHVRPEFGAFEAALRERIERLAAFEDERFARIRGVDRDPDTGELVVVSEFVPGSRLSDLLDVAQEAAQEGITPGVDVALGYLLEALPAISALHAAAGVAHGAIAPARTVLTPAGQVVFLDTPFGEVLERLHFSRRRLWAEFGAAMPPSAGVSRFNARADIGQVALNAVMLVLGRPLREYEYPDALPSLMMEVVEVAQIRGTANFAGGIQRFLQCALPVPGRRVYANADEATVDIRQVARQEIGLAVCRRALIDFISETAEGLAALKSAAPRERGSAQVLEPVQASDFDDNTPALEIVDADAGDSAESLEDVRDILGQDVPLEEEIEAAEPENIYEVSAPAGALVEDLVQDFAEAVAGHAPAAPIAAGPFVAERDASEPVAAEPFVPEPFVADEPFVAEPDVAEPVDAEPFVPEPFVAEPDVAEPFVAEPFVAEEPDVTEPDVPEPAVSEPAVDEEPFVPESPRRKRQRSVRARKDKLRSIAAAGQSGGIGSQPRMAPPPLVGPDRGAYNDPSNDDYPATRAIGFGPPPPAAAPAPPQPAFAPAALAPPSNPIPMPQFPAPPTGGVYTGQSTTIWSAPPLASDPPGPVVEPVPPQAPKPLTLVPPVPPPPAAPAAAAPIKLKTDTPWASKPGRAEPRAARPEAEPYAVLPNVERDRPDEPRPFPWKLAAAAIIIVAAGIVGGRWYLPSRQAPDAEATGTAATGAATPSKAVAAAGASLANPGHIDIQTQPPGAKVLLDGQPAGESPLKLDVAPGRHVLTFVSASGSVKRNVRVDAGKSINVDVPLFSGWVTIFAPIVLNIAENGKAIGTTEEGQLMLAPGRHDLTLSNRDLGYVAKQTVEIESGEVNTLSIEPRGSVNFNAIPWAEVWIDGKKAGETPLANAQVPLGVREIVFKNPEFGERRMVTTVRADSAGALTVDFTKQQE